MANLPWLWEKWAKWWQRAGCSGSHACADIFNKIVLAYTEAHRSYHTLDHLEHCVQELRWFENASSKPVSVELELAVWRHDEVYAPGAPSTANEFRSGERVMADSGHIPHPVAERARHLIHFTADHMAAPAEDEDALLLCDIDLSILGRDLGSYLKYADQIRMEYGFVDEAAYVAGRLAVLRRFQPHPFRTKLFVLRYGYQAADNLLFEIDLLESKVRRPARLG